MELLALEYSQYTAPGYLEQLLAITWQLLYHYANV